MSPKHDSKLDHAVKQIGMRAVRVVEKAAAGGPWTTDAILRAADWLEHGSKDGGVQRPWPNLAARLRNLVAAEANTNVAASAADTAETELVDVQAKTTPMVATQRATKAKEKKVRPTPANATTAAPVTPGGLPFSDLAERYLKHLEKAGKSRGTVFSYSLDLNVAARHFSEDRDVKTITTADVAAYFASDAVQKNRGGGAKNAITIAKLQRTLRLALVWAAEQGLIPAPPIRAKPAKHEKADQDAAIAAATPREKKPRRLRKAAAREEPTVASAGA